MRILRYAVLALAFAAGALPASANPKADIAKAMQAYGSAKSWHADIKMNDGRTVAIDAVMPDKFHEVMPFANMEAVGIAGSWWVKTNGRWMHLPIAMPQMNMMIDMAKQKAMDPKTEDQYAITFLGPAVIGGVATRHYRMTGKDGTTEMWIGANNLPVQMQANSDRGPVTITYSKWNAVPDITAPM